MNWGRDTFGSWVWRDGAAGADVGEEEEPAGSPGGANRP